MTQERYEQFLDEFGTRLQDASEPKRRLAAARGRTLLAGLTVCAAVAASALVLIAPWSGSSDFLARGDAAALTPGPDTVLYESWDHAVPSEGSGHPAYTVGPDQLWVEGAFPHHYRVILQPRSAAASGEEEANPNPLLGVNPASTYGVMISGAGSLEALKRLFTALSGHPLEQGGVLEVPAAQERPGKILRSLTFVPPNELLSAQIRVTLGAQVIGPNDTEAPPSADPVSELREAIAEGRAREDGTTEMNGQTVLCIEFVPQAPPADAPPLPANAPKASPQYAYVDPESFYPVQIGDYHFLAYEYLPSTEANLALTSIQAQHPDAAIVKPPRPTAGAISEEFARRAGDAVSRAYGHGHRR